MSAMVTPDWLRSPLGRAVLASETRAVKQALTQVFGLNMLQIGTWGRPDQFFGCARTRRQAVVAPAPQPGLASVSRPSRLGIASDSVDVVLLPHTLETDPEPHGVLREVERILVGEGHLVVLGFSPFSAWGMRRAISRGRFPDGARRLIPEHRLRDWLSLLGMEMCESGRCVYTPPVDRKAVQRRLGGIDRWAGRYLGRLAGAYLLVAQKRVYSMTPLRPQWTRKPRVVAGLVEPTTRSAA